MSHAPRTRSIYCVVGARPNLMKIAPILRAFQGVASVRLIHTGQHYDEAMSAVFFRELGIAAPDLNLEIGSGTNTEQTARIMLKLEPVFADNRPDAALVVGDVNSTVAAALVASRLLVPVIHVEAGLRSFDRGMPEEINRLVTDRLSDLLLTTEREAIAQLEREGVAPEAIRFVGNVMIDTLYANLARARPAAATIADFAADVASDWEHNGYGFVTLHRPSNVDDPRVLAELVSTLVEISHRLPLVFAMHPRTQKRIESANLAPLMSTGRILCMPPTSYLETIGLTRTAKLVITDSGGLQEETTALGVPCLTVRDNTERPITVHEGTNTLVGKCPAALLEAVDDVLQNGGKRGRIPELWDGKAAERVVAEVMDFLARRDAVQPAVA